MPGLLRFAVCASLLIAFSACESERGKADRILTATDARQLRREAAHLYKDVFAAFGAEMKVVSSSRWPATFQRFAPVRVSAFPDGFSLTLETGAETESGLYIVPLDMEHAPAASPRARFQRLQDGIYWYQFGK